MSRYDDFEGTSVILLQENSDGNSYRFKFETPDTEEGKGSLPYDTQISSVTVSGYAEDGTDVSAIMVDSVSLFPQDEVVVVKLNYPGAEGRYKIRFLLSLNDSSTWEKDFNRIESVAL
jgi:hypothetical protein